MRDKNFWIIVLKMVQAVLETSNALALAADYFVNKNLFSFLSAGNSNFRLRNLKPSLNNTKFTPLWPVQTCKSH